VSTTFSRSTRSLAADSFRGSILGIFIVACLLGAWAAWFFFAQIVLYEVTETARLEVDRAVHPIEALTAGRVIATHLILGQEVQAGDVLVELDANAQRLQLEEERARLADLAAQLEALPKEIAAEERAQRQEQQAARASLSEARARRQEAAVVAKLSEVEAERMARLHAMNYIAELDLLRAQAKAQEHRAATNTLHLAISRLEGDQRTKESERNVRLEQLKREVLHLEGQRATAAAMIERLEYEIERRRIRAPITGRLGEVAYLQIGAVVREADKLGAVVPPGALKVMADFLPHTAPGRLQPGQPARVRLEGFPWTQYGAISAKVSNVATEARNGRVRVELAVSPDAASPIPLQHGLPGMVEVAVDRVSPAILVLRTAGLLLAVPRTSPEPGGGRRADR
jgi:multidrug resistance efflux pump